MAKVTIAPSHRMDSIKEYYFSKKNREIAELRKAGRDIISLGIGSPDMPPAQAVIDRLAKEAQRPDVHAYQPYNGSELLRTAYADWYKKWYNVTLDPKTEVLPLLGSKEGIMHICMAFLDEGDKVLVPNPGYPTYRAAVTLAGGEGLEYRLNAANGFYPNFEEIEAEDLSKVSIGSRVTVVRLSDEAEMTYNIVGSQEANVMEKKISEDSPFGKAVMGKKVGDVAEIKALRSVFGSRLSQVSISSTKSMTGHLLGATAAVEALACVFAIEKGIIPPTINVEEVDPQIDSKLNLTLGTAQKREVKVAMSNTFGFGGHNSTVVFRKL